MEATLIIIQNDADHAEAKSLVEKLMRSSDSADQARMTAQARLIEAYERTRWPRRMPSLPELLTYLMEQHGLSRADLVPLLGTASFLAERNDSPPQSGESLLMSSWVLAGHGTHSWPSTSARKCVHFDFRWVAKRFTLTGCWATERAPTQS